MINSDPGSFTDPRVWHGKGSPWAVNNRTDEYKDNKEVDEFQQDKGQEQRQARVQTNNKAFLMGAGDDSKAKTQQYNVST